MPIDTTHAEYSTHYDRWQHNRAAVSGQDAVKDRQTDMLPNDDALDRSPEAKERYNRYLKRASWLPASGYTHDGFMGMVFRRQPTVDIPRDVDYLLTDASGQGMTLDQVCRQLTSEVFIVGRAGLLVDHPEAPKGQSIADTQGQLARMSLYKAESIDNWRYEYIGGELVLTMVKLQETESVYVDEYHTETASRYRVLRLVDGVYEQALYSESGELLWSLMPTKFDGSQFNRIPFHFVGSDDNLPNCDDALLTGVIDLNVTHYQLSADRMKNLHIHSGALLTVTTDMGYESFAEANPTGVVVGGGDTGLFLGETGKAELLQIQPADAVADEMERIEQRMVNVGAHLITDQGHNKTAESARIDAAGKSSSLRIAVENISSGIRSALSDVMLFMGGGDEIEYSLNTEFYPQTLDAQQVMSLIQLQDRGVIAVSDTRKKLRSASWVDPQRTDEDIDDEAEAAQLL